MPGGRPRGFDPQAALDRALELFRRQGYEGTSLTDLTAAMGINRNSLYATYGNKEQLFRQALDRYAAGPGAFAAEAPAEPTARAVVARMLRGAVELTCGEHAPPGCLSVNAVHACGPESAPVRAEVVARRAAGEGVLRDRFARAPDLPPGYDPATLARLVHTLTDGIAVQAASGHDREQLLQVAELALRALFPAGPPEVAGRSPEEAGPRAAGRPRALPEG